MTVEKCLEDHPLLGAGLLSVALVGAIVGLMFWGGRPQAPVDRNPGTAQAVETLVAYYTTDDGKTWHADSMKKVPPFEENGKRHLGAGLARCPDGHEFVGVLYWFTARDIRRAQQALERNDSASFQAILMLDSQRRSPGEQERDRERGRTGGVVAPPCPHDGKPTEMVFWEMPRATPSTQPVAHAE